MSVQRAAKYLAIVALIAALGLACRGQRGAQLPTEEPTPKPPIPTATPRATVAPTPTHTPTPQPGKRLQAADTYRRNGDYEKAIVEYEAIAAGQAVEEAREALFRIGECHLLNRDYEAAIEALQRFLRAYPHNERRPLALFFSARAYEGLEDWPHAIAYYRRYLARRGVIANYVYELIGDCCMEMGDYEEAVAAYKAALQDVPFPIMEVEVREKAAKAYLELEDYGEAIAQYEAILAIARIGAYRAEILHLTGLVYKGWDKENEAHASFLEAVDRYPRAEHAYLALVELVEDGVAVDEFQRGLVDYYAGAYRPAIRAFRRYIEGDLMEDLDRARYYLGLAYRGAGDYTSAMRRFDVLIEAHPESEYWGWAWLEKAELLAELEKIERAVEVYREFAELHPYHELAGEALWQAARLMDAKGRYREAAQAYLDFRAGFREDERAEEALFRAGLCYHRSTDYGKAMETWQELLDIQGSKMRPEALFWMGKSLLSQGKIQRAWRCFEEAARAKVGGYYAWRAKALSLELRGAPPPFRGEDVPSSAWGKMGHEEAERWLASWLEIPRGDMSEFDPSITDDPRFQRGLELLRVGLWEEAEKELRSLVQKLADSPLALYQLALFFRRMDLTRLSILCAGKLVGLSPLESFSEAPVFLRCLAYPDRFGDLVAKESKTNGLDPLLLLALIRQESMFDAHSTSRAEARGLTQIIPATGEWIALKLGQRDYVADDLYRPCLNVKFGAWYLTRQIEEFEGEVLAALAAYNAGPNKVRRWLEEARGDVDLLVETIPASEPRLFVKGVCKHYAMYRTLCDVLRRREVESTLGRRSGPGPDH